MASSLDMSLDDRIKNRSNRGRGRGGRGRAHSGRGPSGALNGGRMAGAVSSRRMAGASNGGRTTGAVRRGPLMVNTRPSSYAIAKASSKNISDVCRGSLVIPGILCEGASLVGFYSARIQYTSLIHGILQRSFSLRTRTGALTSSIALSIRRARPFPWQHDLFEDSLRAAGIQGVEVGTKLYVSNLDHGVTNEDIRELFSELGELKRFAVHYDKNGHPSGSAEVVYTRRSDAFAALKRYNNVLLDGKPMKIEIVGSNSELPISARVNVTGVNGRRKRTVVMTPRGGQAGGGPTMPNRGAGRGRRGGPRSGSGRGGGGGRGRGRGSRGGGGGRGRGRKDAVEKSAEELDKELETYHAEAMNIS
ncbi:THO complex subunit 4D [Glycine max]|nr:THO complex subunit 4D [Glycine max]